MRGQWAAELRASGDLIKFGCGDHSVGSHRSAIKGCDGLHGTRLLGFRVPTCLTVRHSRLWPTTLIMDTSSTSHCEIEL